MQLDGPLHRDRDVICVVVIELSPRASCLTFASSRKALRCALRHIAAQSIHRRTKISVRTSHNRIRRSLPSPMRVLLPPSPTAEAMVIIPITIAPAVHQTGRTEESRGRSIGQR